MANFASALESVLDDASLRLHDWYENFEMTAGSLFAYGAVFCLAILPVIVFLAEKYTNRSAASVASKKPRLPAASKTLPIPKPVKIKELRVYPIKSCRGIIVPEAQILETGLELDRNWMFVDAATLKFLTIRQISEMTLINTAYHAETDELEVSISTKPGIGFRIAAHPSQEWLKANTELKDCEIWGEEHDGWIYPAGLTEKISEFLGKEVKLVYKGPGLRDLPPQAAPEILGHRGSTKFADFMPVLVANQRSIEELNSRLKGADSDPITIEHFRPNIIVEGEEAWYEDVWKTLRISSAASKPGSNPPGSVTFDIPVRCARCQVPNVNPETGVKNKKQPWDTLMKYRRIDKGITFKPIFGVLCVPKEEGRVGKGDWLEILEVTEEHNYKGVGSP